MRRLSVLGSTGSVGSQTLEVIRAYREEFYMVGLVAKNASEKLLKQAIEFKPQYVVSYKEPSKEWLSSLPEGTTYLRGDEGLFEVIESSEYLMNAISGIDGILPTYHALAKNKNFWLPIKSLSYALGIW